MSWEIGLSIIAIVFPGAGWVISVERRIGQIQTVKEQSDRIEKKLDHLIERLLDS